MKILIAPLHYLAEKSGGSEYGRAYDYLDYLSKTKKIFGDVLVGYFPKSRLGNFRIRSFFRQKPEYISNLTRLRFIVWLFIESLRLRRHNHYDLIWHNGPFAIDETISLISIFNYPRTPFVVGPINSPHTFLGPDENRSMGKKLFSGDGLITRLVILFDHRIYFLSRIFSVFSRLTLTNASLILAREFETSKLLESRGMPESVVFNMGTKIPTRRQANIGSDNDKIRLLSVSYLVERKFTVDLISMMDYLVNELHHINFVLTIVGDGPQRSTLEKAVNRLGLNKYIKFIGYVDKDRVFEYYSSSDIFVSSSISDCMPAMYFEAISSGLPLVVSLNPSVQELIDNGVYCQPVPPHDYRSMAETILRISKSTKFLATMGKRNYHLYQEKYRFENKMVRFIELLKEQIKKGGDNER
jgi:glycosyltransferase involved in cell wall biosynthesis